MCMNVNVYRPSVTYIQLGMMVAESFVVSYHKVARTLYTPSTDSNEKHHTLSSRIHTAQFGIVQDVSNYD